MPKDLSSVRIARLNKLVQELRLHPRISKEELFARLEYGCERTFERDLTYLREEHALDVVYDRSAKHYRLYDSGRYLLRFDLSAREVTALVAGLGMAAHFLPHLGGDSERLWKKIDALLPRNLSEQGEALGRCAVVALPVSAMDPHVFEELLRAVRERKNVRIVYLSPWGDGAEREHELAPWGVFFRAHAWYLWGGSPRFSTFSTYRISRIRAVELLQEPWSVEPPEGACLAQYAASAWYGLPGEAKHTVRLRIDPPLASVVAETVWHSTQKLSEGENGSLFLSACVPDLDEVARWVLASAPHVHVLEPEELARILKEKTESFQ